MKYEIIGSVMPAAALQLEQGEAVYTQSGGMAWMNEKIDMKTNTHGGFMKGLGRMFAGESLFMTTYTATAPGAEIGFSSTVPGAILPVELDGARKLICQKGAFLCAPESVEQTVVFTKKLSSGLFGGEGFILQELSGQGTAFLEIDGDKIEKELAPGEVLLVDTGNIVAFDSTVSYEIQMVKGGMNIFLGGEGLFLTKLTGPGRIVIQTQNFMEFVGRIRPFVANTSN